jgi:hypothetical protein
MEQIIYSNSFSEFLRNSDCKLANILYRLDRKNYNPICLTSEHINYITFRKDGTISYLPSGKECQYNDEGEWSKDGRQNGKPSKVIRKIFTDRFAKMFKDADFECFTNSYKSNFNEEGYTFEILPASQIPSVYDMDRAEGEGSLNGSCMNNDSGYLGIYENCEKLRIVILKDAAGLLCGRALLWTIDEQTTLIDRFYVCKDFMYEDFKNFAKKNNFWRKKDYKSFSDKKIFITPEGEQVEKTFIIHTDTTFDEFPYIDTFQYGDDGYLTNEGRGEQYTYDCTDGTRGGGEENHEGEVYCESREEYINEDYAVYVDEGERRYRDQYHHVDDCVNVNDTWYHEDDCNIVKVGRGYYTTDSEELCEINGEFHLLDDCVYCERDSQYYLSSDCVYCEADGEDILESEAIEIDGEYYHEDSEKIVKIGDEYYTKDSEEIEIVDGEYRIKEEDTDEETEEETN